MRGEDTGNLTSLKQLDLIRAILSTLDSLQAWFYYIHKNVVLAATMAKYQGFNLYIHLLAQVSTDIQPVISLVEALLQYL